jgi:outer membrane lipopolysaccharide assembly protein LptE/RlpB
MKHPTGSRIASIAASAVWLATGCGYHFAGTGNRLPPEIHTISLGPIQNMTREVGIEKTLLESLEDEVASHGRLEAVAAGAPADASLTGSVREYNSRPVSFSSRDEALQYQISMSVDLELRRNDNGKLLWKAVGRREVQDFSAVPGVVVTSSSQFSQQTVNANNLQQFTDIQLSESTKRQANEQLIETLSRDIYNQMMEDF